MVTKQQYGKLAKQTAPRSPLLRDCIWAFCVGGTLCALGQVLGALWQQWMPQQQARTLSSMSLIALSALLTATHCYAPIAKRAGAGTLVPITGFANAISCAAIEFKSEGFIMGVGAKMFIIAGPVIVYGTVASVVYGVIYWITTLF